MDLPHPCNNYTGYAWWHPSWTIMSTFKVITMHQGHTTSHIHKASNLFHSTKHHQFFIRVSFEIFEIWAWFCMEKTTTNIQQDGKCRQGNKWPRIVLTCTRMTYSTQASFQYMFHHLTKRWRLILFLYWYSIEPIFHYITVFCWINMPAWMHRLKQTSKPIWIILQHLQLQNSGVHTVSFIKSRQG